MRTKILILISFIILPFYHKAQPENKNIFIGYLATENKEVFTYQIEFVVNKDNTIKGESTTDIYGKNRTKSIITGNISAHKKELTFKEIQNLSSKSKANENEFCYVECQNIELKKNEGKEIISGKFKGKLPNGTSCASGKIYLVNKMAMTDERLDKTIVDTLLTSKLDFKTITSKNSISIPWKSKTINFYIWDGSTEDDDIISIYFNDIAIKENLNIKNKKELISIPIKSNTKGVLKIKAISSGKEGKNTVNLLFIDKSNCYPFISILVQGESVTFDLK